MTISTVISDVTQDGDGSNRSWTWNFLIPDDESLQIIVTDEDGAETIITTNFTITGIGDAAGGNLTYPTIASGLDPLSITDKLTINRVVPNTQPRRIRNQRRYDPEVVEDALDRLTMQVQQNTNGLGRAVKIPISSNESSENYFATITGLKNDAVAAKTASELAQTGAETAKTGAENAQSYAEEWANKAEDSLVSVAAGGDGVDDYSALHWANKAADSAASASVGNLAVLTTATIVSGDFIAFADVSDSNTGKKTTIADAVGIVRGTLTGNIDGDGTGKLVNMADGTDPQDYVTKAQLDANTPPDASITVKGIVELATSAETITGTDTVRAVTPAGLQAKVASETAIGLVEAATTAEMNAGTANKFPDASKVKAYADSVGYTQPTSVGAVGTYAFCTVGTGVTLPSAGDTISAVNLTYGKASGPGVGSLSGTWRCMGSLAGGAGNTESSTTLFLRIS